MPRQVHVHPRLFVEGAKRANEHAGCRAEMAREHACGGNWEGAGRAYGAAMAAADMAAHIERDIIRGLSR